MFSQTQSFYLQNSLKYYEFICILCQVLFKIFSPIYQDFKYIDEILDFLRG